MTDRGLRPGDTELIAAFLDRRLSEGERREFMERLDRDEALYEVFVETVRAREDATESGAAPVAEHPAGSGPSRWMLSGSIAALLALAVALPLLLRDRGGPTGAGLARSLLEDGRLAGSLAPDWTQQGWRRMRGGLTADGSEIDKAFRVGVHTVDLEIALRLGRREDATGLLSDIQRELRGIDLTEPLRVSYADLREQLEDGLEPERALELALEAESRADEFLDIGYGFPFGKWAEAGKLAAQSGNQELLRSRTFRKMLSRIQARTWSDLVTEELEAIAAALSDRQTDLDLAALEEAFTTLIDAS